MPYQEPQTETLKISVVRGQLNTLVNRVYRNETRVLVEKSGIPVAAMISIDDLNKLLRIERQRAEDFAIIDDMRVAFKDVPQEEIEREAEQAVAEVRAEIRAEREQAALARR
ncbi:hypothetical protein BH23CHL4_BH23CHL4_26900 [soil metagenome]